MMSNGPRSDLRLFHSGCRSIETCSTSSGVFSTWTYRKPSRSSPRRPRRSCIDWLRTTCGPKSRSGRARFRSWQTSSRSRSTIATGSTSCSRASSTSGRRASGCTFVASMTVNSPRASRLPATYCSTSNASPVAAWLFSSSLTSPRQKSDEITSVGLKCLRANVDFPQPLGPIRTTRESSGRVSFTAVSLKMQSAGGLRAGDFLPRNAAEPQQQVVQGGSGGRRVRQAARIERRLQFAPEAEVLAAVDVEVGLAQGGSLGPGQLAGNQFWHVRQRVPGVQREEVRLHLAGLHQVNARQQHPKDVQQRLDPPGALLREQLPLGLGEAEVMVRVVPRNAPAADRLQLLVLRRSPDHKRRVELLQHVPVLLEHQAEELARVMRDKVHFEAVVDAGGFDRLRAALQPQHVRRGQHVHPAQVIVTVRRRKAV